MIWRIRDYGLVINQGDQMNKLVSTLLLSFVSTAALACPVGTESRASNQPGVQYCALKGTYLSTDLRLTSEYQYIIEEGVFIGGDNVQKSTLRIEPGTILRGTPGAFISIMRGSQIFATGTAAKPIVFTSTKLADRKRGEWGGLVISGNAPINKCGNAATVCEAISEGIKVKEVKFGGNQPDDNSGVLQYVRVEFAGYPISIDNELNGITFNAVGSQTTLENIQVHMNADDGIEFFGGTANAKNIVLTENEDDSLDWDMGWTGMIQFLVVDQGIDQVDNGIEADNLQSPMTATPRSNPVISHMTLIGSEKSSYGMLLRRGTGAQIFNTIITGFKKACIDIDDAETFRNAASGGMTFTNSIFNCTKTFEAETGDAFSTEVFIMNQPTNRIVNPQLQGWMPSATSPALRTGTTPEDFFFEPVDYIGAFGATDWTLNWISRERK